MHSFDLQYTSDVEEGASFPLEGSPEGLAFTSRRPVVIRNLDLEEFPAPQIKHAYDDGLRSACIIPLVAHDRALGTLDIASRSENSFTEQDAELLTHIAGQIAIAVENALAYREISPVGDQQAGKLSPAVCLLRVAWWSAGVRRHRAVRRPRSVGAGSIFVQSGQRRNTYAK